MGVVGCIHFVYISCAFRVYMCGTFCVAQNVRRVVEDEDSQGDYEEELDDMELWARSCVYVSPARARLLLSLDDGPAHRPPPPQLLWRATRPHAASVKDDGESWQRLAAALQHLQRCE